MPLANAVFWTARKGNVTLLRLLLNSGRMDADCRDSLGTTALMVASYCNHKDCVRELILQGANINIQRESGSTALYFAAQQGNDTVVKFLLEYGASTELSTKDGATPLSIASQYGHINVVETLLNRRCNVNIQLKDGASSLFLAAQGGHFNVVHMLLASGAKTEQPRQDLTTPLWIAAQMGHTDIVKLLLQWGANSDTPRKDGSTPLFKAAYKGFTEVVRELLTRSPSLGILKESGFLLLLLSSCSEKLIVNLLGAVLTQLSGLIGHFKEPLKFSHEVWFQNHSYRSGQNGTTALHAAVLGGSIRTVRLLIDSGADPSLRNTIYLNLCPETRIQDERFGAKRSQQNSLTEDLPADLTRNDRLIQQLQSKQRSES